MSKDFIINAVTAGIIATKEDESLKGTMRQEASGFVRTKDLKVKLEHKQEGRWAYTDSFERGVLSYLYDYPTNEPISTVRILELGEQNPEKHNTYTSAMEIGEELAKMAFIDATRSVTNQQAMDFNKPRTRIDMLLEERAPHLANSRRDRVNEVEHVESTTIGNLSPSSTPKSTSSSISR